MFIYKHDLFIVIITICDYILPLYLDINSYWFFPCCLIVCCLFAWLLNIPRQIYHPDLSVLLMLIILSFIMCVRMCSVTQSCLTLCDPTNCSPPGSPLHAIFQARILEQVAISYFRSHHNMVLYSSLSLMTPLQVQH